jgi:hypothetical protein
MTKFYAFTLSKNLSQSKNPSKMNKLEKCMYIKYHIGRDIFDKSKEILKLNFSILNLCITKIKIRLKFFNLEIDMNKQSTATYAQLQITESQAEKIASDFFGLNGRASYLDGEIDFNFKITCEHKKVFN